MPTLGTNTDSVAGQLVANFLDPPKPLPRARIGIGELSHLMCEMVLEALASLRNVVSRVAAAWRPANADESLEIVRRRLFQPMDNALGVYPIRGRQALDAPHSLLRR
jgi:hypothetical protein